MLKLFTIFVVSVFIFTGCADKNHTLTHNLGKKETIYSIKQAKSIDMPELAKQLEHYPVIFVGDHHNTQKTHKFFQNLLRELDAQGYNLYLANEWFTPEHDGLLKDYTDGKISAKTLKEKREWDKFTKYKWEYVEPLYETIKKNGGRLYGMNIPEINRKKISLRQFDTMTQEEKDFYNSLDVNVSAHYQLVEPFLKHCHKMPAKSEESCEQRMYRVQVAWDTYMALNVSKIAQKVLKTPKDKLFVFAGAMHMEQALGIPLRFSRLNNKPFIIISNQKIQKDEELKLDTNKADVVYIYD